MDWVQGLIAIASIATILSLIFGIVKWAVSDIKKQVSDMNLGLKTSMAEINSDIKIQGRRTDHLYQMFVDLLKDNNKEKKERKVKK